MRPRTVGALAVLPRRQRQPASCPSYESIAARPRLRFVACTVASLLLVAGPVCHGLKKESLSFRRLSILIESATNLWAMAGRILSRARGKRYLRGGRTTHLRSWLGIFACPLRWTILPRRCVKLVSASYPGWWLLPGNRNLHKRTQFAVNLNCLNGLHLRPPPEVAFPRQNP